MTKLIILRPLIILKIFNGLEQAMIIYYTMNEIVTKTSNLDVNKFYKDWYISLKGMQYVVGTNAERNKLNLQGRGFLMPFVQRVRYIDIVLYL